jgi:HPr kinase/phosphorylase
VTDPAIDGAPIHASCVALGARGLLILGPSGSGKSALALRLMALGAVLVADDQTLLHREGDALIARCPPPLSGLIEARFVGLLRTTPQAQARIALVVDLAQHETARIPARRAVTLQGVTLDLVLRAQSDHFPAALLCYLAGGRAA